MTTLVNQGLRTWDLHDGVEVDGKVLRRKKLASGEYDPKDKVVKRRLAPRGQPGSAIEALDADEATHMLSYSREIIDSTKIIPATGDKVKALTEERDALKARVAELEAQLPKDPPKEDDKSKKK